MGSVNFVKKTRKYKGVVPVDILTTEDTSALGCNRKRKPYTTLGGQREKRRTLDPTVKKGKENRSSKAIKSILDPKPPGTTARMHCFLSYTLKCHERETIDPPESHRKRLCLHSDRHVLNEDSNKHIDIATPPTEGWKTLHTGMSAERALHVAMLKHRFANTIFKATHQTLLDRGAKINFVMMCRERERLRREKAEDNAKIEAEVQAASRNFADNAKIEAEVQATSRKMGLKREREAARMKLEKMQKTIDIYENLEVMKEFDKMVCHRCEILEIEEGEIVSP